MFVLIIVIHTYVHIYSYIYGSHDYCLNFVIKNNELTAVRILCILPKFHHITDLLMNLQWLPVHQRILLDVLVLTYNLSGIFFI